eukprot:g5289.t1
MMEFVNAVGLRVDGRRPAECRNMRHRFRVVPDADGSVYMEHGNNKVLVSVFGPRTASAMSSSGTGIKVKRRRDEATVSCEYLIAPFARTEHRRTRTTDRKSVADAAVLQRILAATIDTGAFPGSNIHVYSQVLEADGAEFCCVVNATMLALLDAGIPCRDFVVGCTAGILDGHKMVDLNYVEHAANGPVVTLVSLPITGKTLLLKMDNGKASMHAFEGIYAMAETGCRHIYNALQAMAKEHVAACLS